MTRIEHALFTATQTNPSAGYHVVAMSPAVADVDRRELALRGPMHAALWESAADAVSVDFFPLPSGVHGIARTTPIAAEAGGRGRSFATHCLLVPPDVLRRFANNPLAVLRSAVAVGAIGGQSAASLEPVELPGSAAPVDGRLLARLSETVGPCRLALLLQTVLTSPCVAVRGPVPLEDLVAGVIACLPVECRTAVSFSTGLVQCSPRPPRIVAMPPSGVMPRRLTAAANVVTLDLTTEEPRSSRLVDHWARLIERTLDTGQFCFLAEELSRARPDIAADDLSALGLQLLEDLEASRLHERGDEPLRAHAAHRRFEKTAQAATAPPRTGPSQFLHADSPEVVTKLEVLDDVVFDAVGGCAQSLQRLNSIWPALRAELGDDLLAESREQYLRYAVSIWERCIAEDVIRDPVRAVQVLDVLCVLFDET